jgi:DNA-binding HxlR family transcriptional regulator
MYESQDNCPVGRTLGMIANRWTILILRDLFRGYLRYNDLLRSLEGISPNLLPTD